VDALRVRPEAVRLAEMLSHAPHDSYTLADLRRIQWAFPCTELYSAIRCLRGHGVIELHGSRRAMAGITVQRPTLELWLAARTRGRDEGLAYGHST